MKQKILWVVSVILIGIILFLVGFQELYYQNEWVYWLVIIGYWLCAVGSFIYIFRVWK